MKRLERFLLPTIMVGILVVSGCASGDPSLPPRDPGYGIRLGPKPSSSTLTSTSGPTQGSSSQQAAEIPVGKAMVYIYHSGGSNHRFFLQANGKDVISLRKNQYYTYVTEPGVIEFTAKTMGASSITVDAKAGQSYYLKGSVPPGFSPTPSLVSVSQEVGAQEIADCRLISSP